VRGPRLTDRAAAPDHPLPAQQQRADNGTAAGPAVQPADPHPPAWQQAARRARTLSWVSLIWMSAEGITGLIAGVQAQSISLTGWALGSVIEGLASVIVIWRFTGTRTLSETAESRAQQAVAVSFFLLAPYITLEAVRDLLDGHQAGVSGLGVIVTAASLVVMPFLAVAKKRLGAVLGSGATAGEDVQNLICAAQAGWSAPQSPDYEPTKMGIWRGMGICRGNAGVLLRSIKRKRRSW